MGAKPAAEKFDINELRKAAQAAAEKLKARGAELLKKQKASSPSKSSRSSKKPSKGWGTK